MTLIFAKGRELFAQDSKNHEVGQATVKDKGLKRTPSGKVLFSSRKRNNKRR